MLCFLTHATTFYYLQTSVFKALFHLLLIVSSSHGGQQFRTETRQGKQKITTGNNSIPELRELRTDYSDDFWYLPNVIDTDKRAICSENAIQNVIKCNALNYQEKQRLCGVIGKVCKPQSIFSANLCFTCVDKTKRYAM